MDKNGYRAPIITAAIITAIATLILAIATVIAPRFNQPAPVVVKIQPPAQSDPLPKEPPLSSQQPDEPVEEEQSTVSNPSSQPAPPPSSEKPVQRIETKPITDRPIQRPETNPNYVLKDGEATFVSSIATSLSATFQNVDTHVGCMILDVEVFSDPKIIQPGPWTRTGTEHL